MPAVMNLSQKKDICPVIITAPAWDLCGINTVSAGLIRGLNELGISAHVLLTHSWREPDDPMPAVPGIVMERLPGARVHDLRHNWRCLKRYLEESAPCIYIPNYDFEHSCICPRLCDQVMTVGIIHSDDPVHYDHFIRMGEYWNATVAVSRRIAEEAKQRCPQLAERISVVENGVEVPGFLSKPSRVGAAPLEIVYAGRISQYQKRVLDLPRIMSRLAELGARTRLTVVGSGPEESKLRSACDAVTDRGAIRFLKTLPREETMELFEKSDVVILTSDFEGMPMTLLEAMAHGCIPVVTDIASGVPELVEDGVTGYRVRVGDIDGFAKRITTIGSDAALRERLSAAAHQKVAGSVYTTSRMVSQYVALFDRIRREVDAGAWRRPRGPMRLASWVQAQYEQQRLLNRIRVKGAGIMRSWFGGRRWEQK